ncbi:MAG: matrixin family metalloprotease [Deltaproteobacteria bacterium]|nr:matrixin family metalloprotease [Deltaproteobacteria bacterium]
MRRLLGVALAAALPFPARAFAAFTDPSHPNAPVRWPSSSVGVVLQSDGSDDVTDGSDLAAVRAAITQWNTALGGRLTVTEGAPVSSRAWGDDGVNAVIFVESGWPGAADGALGTTIPNIQAGNPSTFTDADVLLNGTEAPWVTDGNPFGVDVQSIAGHELGHLLGLWHAWDSRVAMYTGARRGTTFRHQLSDDDIRGARYLSPGAFTCTSNADCPLLIRRLGGENTRLVCNGGACVPGAAGYGAECVDDNQCTTGLCLRDVWSTDGYDPGACSRACTPGGTDCQAGDACAAVGAAHVCAPGRGCVVDADCGGGSNNRCLLDFDGAYRCRHLCMRDGNCTAPARCIDLGYGAGICAEPGTRPTGDACLNPYQCVGLACRGAAGDLRCAVAPPKEDGGVVVVPDAGPRTDAGTPRPDGGTADAAGPYYPPYEEVPEEPPPDDGCACAAPGRAPAWWRVLLSALFLARRRVR